MQKNRTTGLSINLNKSSIISLGHIPKETCALYTATLPAAVNNTLPALKLWLTWNLLCKTCKIKGWSLFEAWVIQLEGERRALQPAAAGSREELSLVHQSLESFCRALGNLEPAMSVPAKPPQSSNPPSGYPQCPNHALSFVIVSLQKNFIATDDRSIQQHCSCSRHAANQQPEQMECKSPSEGGPGGCHQPAPTT